MRLGPNEEIPVPYFKGSLSGIPEAVDASLMNSRLL